MRDIICELCGIGQKSYYVWKNKSHIELINLIEKYFAKEDLQEFLQTGKIQKLDYVDTYLINLKNKCRQIYIKIEKMEIEHKNPNVDFRSVSMFYTQNLYKAYLSPFLRKNKEKIKKFEIENFKADLILLVLLNPFEYKENGIPEPLVTFQILSILDELSSSEMHYFFNEYDKIVHDDLADLS